MVRRLSAGGNEIRTAGPTYQMAVLSRQHDPRLGPSSYVRIGRLGHEATDGSNPIRSSAESGTNRRRRVRGRCSLLGSCFARSLDDGRYRTVISSREHTRVQKFPLRRRSRDACATRLAAELLDPMRHLELIRVCRLLPAAEAPDQMVAAVRELGVARGARARVGAPLPIRSSSSGCGSAPGRRSRPQCSAAPAPRR